MLLGPGPVANPRAVLLSSNPVTRPLRGKRCRASPRPPPCRAGAQAPNAGARVRGGWRGPAPAFCRHGAPFVLFRGGPKWLARKPRLEQHASCALRPRGILHCRPLPRGCAPDHPLFSRPHRRRCCRRQHGVAGAVTRVGGLGSRFRKCAAVPSPSHDASLSPLKAAGRRPGQALPPQALGLCVDQLHCICSNPHMHARRRPRFGAVLRAARGA